MSWTNSTGDSSKLPGTWISVCGHAAAFEWLAQAPRDWQIRPGGWPETRYEAKARNVFGHEVWYFRFRRR